MSRKHIIAVLAGALLSLSLAAAPMAQGPREGMPKAPDHPRIGHDAGKGLQQNPAPKSQPGHFGKEGAQGKQLGMGKRPDGPRPDMKGGPDGHRPGVKDGPNAHKPDMGGQRGDHPGQKDFRHEGLKPRDGVPQHRPN